jgi:acyl dehydratase
MSSPLADDTVLGFRFPGGRYTIAHWENFLLTDCTTAEQLPDNLVHPVALFHVPILGSGISIAKLFEVCGAEGPGSVGLDGYDWEYFSPLRIDVEYDVQGSIVHWEHKLDDNGNAYDAMKFQIELRDVARDELAARITNSWRFRRQHATQAYKKPPRVEDDHDADTSPREQIPAFTVASVDAQRMKTMAAILRDPYRVHWDRQATRDMGLDGRVINQGPLNLSYIVNALHNFAGAGCVRRLTVQFHRPVFDGDHVEGGGEVIAESNESRECTVWLRRGNETVVSGTAVIAARNS